MSVISIEDLHKEAVDCEKIITSIGDGISIQDSQYRIIFQNQAHINMAGDHLGKICYEAYARKTEICDGCPVQKSFRDGSRHNLEKQNNPLGKEIYIEITSSPLRSASGDIIAVIESVRDITKRKEAELLLKQTLADLDNKVEQRTAALCQTIKEKEKVEDSLRESTSNRSFPDTPYRYRNNIIKTIQCLSDCP